MSPSDSSYSCLAVVFAGVWLTVPLYVQFGQLRSNHSVPFTLYDVDQPTEVLELVPQLGPPAGGTRVEVAGANFANGATCFFGDRRVPTTFMSVDRVRCASPEASAVIGSVSLTVGTEDGNRRGESRLFTVFLADSPPVLRQAVPDYSSMHEATVITILGSNFAPLGERLACVFDGRHTADHDAGARTFSPATFVSGGELRCLSPTRCGGAPCRPDTAPLQVVVLPSASSGARLLSDSLPFHIFDPSLIPTVTPLGFLAIDAAADMREIQLLGAGFSPLLGAMSARIGTLGPVPVTFVRTGVLRLLPPRLGRDQYFTAPLELDIGEGGAFVPTGTSLTYYTSRMPPAVNAVSPPFGDFTSTHPLELSGWNFAPIASLSCWVDGQQAPASFIDAQHMRCAAPPTVERSPVTVRVAASIDGGRIGRGANFTYFIASAAPTLSPAITPSFLPLGGETRVLILGDNLAPTGDKLACRFGARHTATRATFITVHEVACLAPRTLVPGSVDVTVTTNGWARYSNRALFTRYDPHTTAEPSLLSPLAVRIRQSSTTIVVVATNIAPTRGLACMFGAHGSTPATFDSTLDSTRLRCAAPALERQSLCSCGSRWRWAVEWWQPEARLL